MTATLVDEEIKSWISGTVIGDVTNGYAERRVIYQTDRGFTFLRAYPLGNGAAVSVDQEDVTAAEMMRYLLEQIAS